MTAYDVARAPARDWLERQVGDAGPALGKLRDRLVKR
jgi:hypothetical protein